MLIFTEVIGLIITIICKSVINENKSLSYSKKFKFKELLVIYILLIITVIHMMIYYHIQLYNFLIYIFITLQILTIEGKINERKIKKQVLGDSFI